MFTKDNVGPFKNVAGRQVLMTDTERQAVADEWNAADAEIRQQLHAARLQQVREAREVIINRLNGIAGRKYRGNEKPIATACDAAVVSLLSITTGLPDDVELVAGEVLKRCQAIADGLAAASPEAATAFKGVSL